MHSIALATECAIIQKSRGRLCVHLVRSEAHLMYSTNCRPQSQKSYGARIASTGDRTNTRQSMLPVKWTVNQSTGTATSTALMEKGESDGKGEQE